MTLEAAIIRPDDLILITGATGFIGPAVIEGLLRHGYKNIRAFSRPSSNVTRLEEVATRYEGEALVEIIQGNLLSAEDCAAAAKGASVIIHLATSGSKSFPDAVMNSVVTTRNLLDASLQQTCLRRFVNISSFAVYSNTQSQALDESSPLEQPADLRGDAYTFAKLMQDDVVIDYGKRFDLPYVIVRPGSVYGPGKTGITGRVGIDTFGMFVHLGGSNRIPLTYLDNCADAIVLAAVTPGVDGEVFNVVDDDLPSSRKLLGLYKKNVRSFRSIYLPHAASFALCWMWERYSAWSQGQLPPAFNRSRWRAEWKKTSYSNRKLKEKLGWRPRVAMNEGLERFFAGCQERRHA